VEVRLETQGPSSVRFSEASCRARSRLTIMRAIGNASHRIGRPLLTRDP
jgi:hypothetical protein